MKKQRLQELAGVQLDEAVNSPTDDEIIKIILNNADIRGIDLEMYATGFASVPAELRKLFNK